MYRILNLIQNENMKIYRRKATMIMFSIMIIVIIAVGLLTKFAGDKSYNNKNWKQQLSQQIINDQNDLEKNKEHMAKFEKENVTKRIKVNQYRLEHDIAPDSDENAWGFVTFCANLVALISLFTIIVGAGTVAKEHSTGTIKLLLIRPMKRWKVLLSKFASMLLFALGMLATLFVVSFIVGGILYGFKGLNSPYLAYVTDHVVEKNMLLHIIATYFLKCVDLVMMVSFAFMISTVFRSNSLAIGLALFLMFTGNMVVGILVQLNQSWGKFILFANTDLTQYIDGRPAFAGMTLGFSVIMLVLYFVAFNATSFAVFSKRDVT